MKRIFTFLLFAFAIATMGNTLPAASPDPDPILDPIIELDPEPAFDPEEPVLDIPIPFVISNNPYKFIGKEVVGGTGYDMYDFGARFYTPYIPRWLTMDPLAEKYYDISPYAYCAVNPINRVDPEGKKLYFAKGSTEAFKKSFAEAIKIMNEKETSYNIAKLEASDQKFYIQQSKNNQFDPNSKTIEWNPYKVSYDEQTNILRSPLTSLAHEAGHANNYREALENESLDNFKESINTSDLLYDNVQERGVITTTEQYAARHHGEISGNQVTRKDHRGENYPGGLPDFSKMTMLDILNYVIATNQFQGSVISK